MGCCDGLLPSDPLLIRFKTGEGAKLAFRDFSQVHICAPRNILFDLCSLELIEEIPFGLYPVLYPELYWHKKRLQYSL